ncbi:MAG: zinc-binding dehydrogenase [Candidatus Tectomicrobia bacterium]|uniref:Zinc-binding dehydrogenase n=1 Tax=Tectimicrobiota bacterium TaxID=2528274 RepID=A0A938B1Y9_UNCTE|nr:zinc-binding dehydrogenase [Candidatus Tectomicrobia bacterium]
MPASHAVVVDHATPGSLAIRQVAASTPLPSEAVVRVAAISLNRGETRRSMQAADGWRPGWDLAGVVEHAAADGSGPQPGTRVVGLLPSGAWAESIAVPTHALAVLPNTVTFAQAATLPVAGLTALYALAKRGLVLQRRVLITGATGGVGDFALQLARLAGAHVVANVRRAEQSAVVRQSGAHDVVVGESVAAFAQYGPYDLVVDSVGGQTLASALAVLAKDGACVSLGISGAGETTFDVRQFFMTGRTALYGFILFAELESEPAAVGLSHLASLVAAGTLQPHISLEAPWSQVADVARQLLDRTFPGKAVLHVG